MTTDTSQKLQVQIGCATDQGIKSINEDAVAFCEPDDEHLVATKGICCALADGVSSAEAGQQASEISTRRFVEDYYLSPETWSVKHAGQKILSASNLTLYKKSHEFANQDKGYLCTFEGLVFKSQTVHFFHVGDSRIHRIRDGELKLFSRDHIATISQDKSYLTRALGMDNNINIDYGKAELREGDIWMISSDGVHDFVSDEQLLAQVQSGLNQQENADALIQKALSQGSDDNLSCIIVEIKTLAKESLDDFNSKLTRLPFPPALAEGMVLDGYMVKKELFASARSQLYLVEDTVSGELMVMKTPSENFIDDTHYIDRFIQEEWIGKRISNDRVVRIINQNRPRTALYYLMEWVPGKSLDKWIKHHHFPSPKRAIAIVKQIAEGLSGFHDKETIHQDLRPANIMIDDKDNIKIVDFGSTFVAGTAEIFSPIEHEGALGTASYADPQYLLGKNSGIQGDLYALATISYELFTGQLPYGDKVEECQTAFDYDHLRYQSASYHNPVIPIWFDRALEKGVRTELEERYLTINEFLADLTHPNPEFLKDVPEVKNQGSKVVFWMFLSGFWIMMLVVIFSMFNTN